MTDLDFLRALKLMSDEQIFEVMHNAQDFDDGEFRVLVSEAIIRLFGAVK